MCVTYGRQFFKVCMHWSSCYRAGKYTIAGQVLIHQVVCRHGHPTTLLCNNTTLYIAGKFPKAWWLKQHQSQLIILEQMELKKQKSNHWKVFYALLSRKIINTSAHLLCIFSRKFPVLVQRKRRECLNMLCILRTSSSV